MKFSISSILLVSAAWTVQAIPTAIPSSLGGRARGLPYNAVRSVHQSQRRLARQQSTATGEVPVPDVTIVADIPTSAPLPPITTNVIVSELTEITSVADDPTTEPLLPPTTTDAITSEAIRVPQTLLVKVRQETEVANPSPTLDLPAQLVTPIETFVESLTADLQTNVPTAVETFVARSPYTDTASPPTNTTS